MATSFEQGDRVTVEVEIVTKVFANGGVVYSGKLLGGGTVMLTEADAPRIKAEGDETRNRKLG